MQQLPLDLHGFGQCEHIWLTRTRERHGDDVTVLTKPFRVDDLLAVIESLAAREPALAPA